MPIFICGAFDEIDRVGGFGKEFTILWNGEDGSIRIRIEGELSEPYKFIDLVEKTKSYKEAAEIGRKHIKDNINKLL